MSDEEKKFPVAFARIVYKDYRFLEMEFAAEYAPQNVFCFAIDSKAPEAFHARIHSLASCFSNVVVTRHEYAEDSAGHNLAFTYFECFKQLLEHPQHWKYVITLQNHDVLIKTNQEIVQILKWLIGANDIEVYHAPAARVNYTADWSFKGLKLFKNGSLNASDKKLTLAKGLDESAISRAAVEFTVNMLDVERFLGQINTNRYGTDEIVFPTLDASDELAMPGGFTGECLRRGKAAPGMTRYTNWYGSHHCGSGHIRHWLCVFGVEDLPRIVDLPQLVVNKLMPEVDFGAFVCLHELMFKRTYSNRTLSRLKREFYTSLPQVRYQTERRKPDFNLSKFDCESHESSFFFHQ